MSTSTPNMNLTKPGVSTEPGPDWATQLNASLDAIDAHDHSSGKGVKVTQAGINITADLEMNNAKLTEIAALVFQTQGSAPGGPAVYVLTSDGELYYKTSGGLIGKLTVGGQINTDFSNNNVIVGQALLGGSSNIVSVASSPYGVAAGDLVLLVSTAAARTVNLPAANAGRRFLFIKDSTGSGGTNNITINRAGSDTIDGGTFITINTNFGAKILVSNGSNAWSVLSTS